MKKTKHSTNRQLYLVLILAVIILFTLDIFLGSVKLSFHDVLSSLFTHNGSISDTIITKFRIPKALTALIAGIALSLSGLQMQTTFRNPMAGPDVLGVSSGASLGVALVILGSSSGISLHSAGTSLDNWIIVIAACMGSAAILFLMIIISLKVRDIMTLLIIGIMLAAGISAFVTILQYFSSESMLKSYVLWTMGSLGNLTGGQLKILSIFAFSGILLSFLSSKMMNAMLLGENYARSLGMNVPLARYTVFLCNCILTGSITAFCGPIGFIGIAVPHIARILFRTSDHRILVPATALTGGSIMISCDIISQLPGSEHILPVNAVASFIGIPVVIWIIMRNRKYSSIF